MMLDTMNDPGLTNHLLEIANNSSLRQAVYDHLGEYCHQFRNRLNSLKLCLYLAKRQCCASTSIDMSGLEVHYASLERSIELIQTMCRPMMISPASLGLDLLIDDRSPGWARIAAEHEVELECVPPLARAVARFDPDRMSQALDALVRWRLPRIGSGSSARLTWRVDREVARITWQERALDFSPSFLQADPDDDWALPLIARIAEAHRGEIRVQAGENWNLEITWPSHPDPSGARTIQ